MHRCICHIARLGAVQWALHVSHVFHAAAAATTAAARFSGNNDGSDGDAEGCVLAAAAARAGEEPSINLRTAAPFVWSLLA